MIATRIVLANHHPMIRSGLRVLLEREIGFKIVGEAANGREAVVLADYKHPDIVLLEVNLPHVSGIAAAKEISAHSKTSRIIFVTTFTDESYVIEAFKAGASGYVAADAAPTDLVRAIHAVNGGGKFLSSEISMHLLDEYARTDSDISELSEYQKHLCCYLAAGYDTDGIARAVNGDLEKVENDCDIVSSTLQGTKLPEFMVNSVRENQQLLLDDAKL
jgi:two-component system, NarL family, response regulator NreC